MLHGNSLRGVFGMGNSGMRNVTRGCPTPALLEAVRRFTGHNMNYTSVSRSSPLPKMKLGMPNMMCYSTYGPDCWFWPTGS